MDKNPQMLIQLLKLTYKTSDIELIIKKVLELLLKKKNICSTSFYWLLNKKSYLVTKHQEKNKNYTKIKEQLPVLTEELLKKQYKYPNKYQDIYIVKKLTILPEINVYYIPILWHDYFLGTIAFSSKNSFENRYSEIINIIKLFALSIAHAECQFKIRKNKYEAINAMIAVIEALDTYTRNHSKNVANYALLLAEELKLPPQTIEEVYYGALFHDIGKIGTSISIIQKQDSLTDKEYEIIKTHPEKGALILENFTDFQNIISIVRHHHESFSGGGYPQGLAGKNIPLGARIVSVADAYDAITTNRSYDKAKDAGKAIDEIQKNTPQQFDPEIVEAFIRIEKNL